ncbi:MAG: glycosyltransferase family 2 protein [Lachnospiraceae bacterium]|nr:glycosyltransferase family 2 protein [Lachnospiraceae bacterium]
MMNKMDQLTTPVAFFTFNRLSTTKQVFEAIRQARPRKLYLVSDGARARVAGEKEKVDEVRAYLESHIDWECEVHKNYAEQNMGCGRRVSSGISWVFDQEEEAIILEDDCLPDPTFFTYCQEMLAYYRDDERIMVIGGSNPAAYYETEQDYLFTKVPFIWGWASWRRAWKLYDFDIKSWEKEKKNPVFRKVLPLKSYWVYTAEFDALYRHSYDTWDYQLMYATLLHDKLNIVPRQSYTRNIGFQEESTHTSGELKSVELRAGACRFPIRHREEVVWDEEFDRTYFKRANGHGLIVKIKSILGLDVNRSVFGK